MNPLMHATMEFDGPKRADGAPKASATFGADKSARHSPLTAYEASLPINDLYQFPHSSPVALIVTPNLI